jgi:hypothetical protein
VVFKDGAVKSSHETEEAAYNSAVETFGAGGGYVIAPVVESPPTPIRAAVIFGLSHA